MTDQPGLHIPGRPQRDGGNPLVLLSTALEGQSQVIRDGLNAILQLMSKGQEHIYGLQPVEHENASGWMTYCLACSNAQQRYVHPCAVVDAGSLQVPPPMFVTAPPPLRAVPSDSGDAAPPTS
jgi:hypothetical protein